MISDSVVRIQASACRCEAPAVDGVGNECMLCGHYPLEEIVLTALEVRYGGVSVFGKTSA